MKRLELTVLCLLALLLSLPLPAAGRAEEPHRRFVPADSVLFFDARRTNFRFAAACVDTGLRPQATEAGSLSARGVRKARKAWETDVAAGLNAVGGRGDELQGEQTFAAARAARASARLFLLTGEGRCFDVVDRVLYNALPSALLPEAPFFERRVAAQTMLDATGWIYAADGEGVYVNLYANCYASIRTPGFCLTLDQITSLPTEPRVRFRVGGLPRGFTRFKLRLRLPEWGGGAAAVAGLLPAAESGERPPVVYVNGRETPCETENGYIVIERDWRNRDEVFFDFDLRPRLVRRAADGACAWRRGPEWFLFQAGAVAALPGTGTQEEVEADLTATAGLVLRFPGGVQAVSYGAVAPQERAGWRLWEMQGR